MSVFCLLLLFVVVVFLGGVRLSMSANSDVFHTLAVEGDLPSLPIVSVNPDRLLVKILSSVTSGDPLINAMFLRIAILTRLATDCAVT